jgi:hypothetical protein
MSPTSCQTAPPRARSTKTEILAAFRFWSQTFFNVFLQICCCADCLFAHRFRDSLRLQLALLPACFRSRISEGRSLQILLETRKASDCIFLLHLARFAHCFFAHRSVCLGLEVELDFSSFFRVPNNEARSLQMRFDERKHFCGFCSCQGVSASPACVLDALSMCLHMLGSRGFSPPQPSREALHRHVERRRHIQSEQL